jgi:pyruvate,water dikinase
MLIEASWGLGESVVSGRVTPDGEQPVPPELRDRPCLDDRQLAELAELGRRVEEYYGDPRDLEWALAGERFWLLQARPITTAGAAERAQVRQEEVAALAALADPGGTVWVRMNLAEVLPAPTPMTWAIVRGFMSGRGGFGLVYRDLGFDPDPALDEAGVFDLVCGRPYCNLGRFPRLQFRQPPVEYSFAALKADPQRAISPQPVPNFSRVGLLYLLKLPVVAFRTAVRIARAHNTVADRLRTDLLPAFAAETAQEAAGDLARLDVPALRQRLTYWIQRTLYDLARETLKPTTLAGMTLESLEHRLARALGPERTRTAVGELIMGARPDPEADLPGALRDLAAGKLDRAAFLARFGHRGSQEMELSHPRWSEDHADLDRLLSATSAGGSVELADFHAAWERIAAEARLGGVQRAAVEKDVQRLHTYLGLRETGKHYLMMGYALIRRILLELDRRHQLGGGIFFLTPDELPRLEEQGTDWQAVIGQRRRRRTLALSLEMPSVLFSDDLEAIGRPVPVAGADTLHGVPLSAGSAEAKALVLHEPEGATLPPEPYILVCPSTDPAWVPLFVHARGLVMETGGVLSHGAIVAREFGPPAVAGLPDVHRRLRTGQRLRVDGSTGTVTVLDP